MHRAVILCAIVGASLIATEVSARDLLSAGNPPKAAVQKVAVVDLSLYPKPFTTTRGKASYVCSISGLGHTSRCVIRTWAERSGSARRTATN